MEGMEKNVQESEKQIVQLSSELALGKTQLNELEELRQKLSPETAVCPLCNCPLTKEGLEHVITERNAKILETRAKITEAEAKLPKAKEMHEKLAKDLKNAQLMDGRLALLRQSLADEEKLKAEVSKLVESAKATAAKKEELQKAGAAINKEVETIILKINELENSIKKQATLKFSEEKLRETKERLEKTPFDPLLYDNKRTAIESAKIEVERLAAAFAGMKEQLKVQDELLSTIAKEIAHLQSIEKEVIHLAKLEEELTIYKSALLETQLSLRASLVEAINLAMNEIWHIFYPHRNYRAIRLNVSEKDYSLEVHDNEWKTLERIASGGERACAVLTLRVALATVLTPNLSLLILDEPTHNLDKDAIELLSNTLQFKVPSIIEQTVIISHEEALIGSDFATSYRLSRDKENFGATIAERV
jgi:DNA repair exonuclease SbcCD ATPase subunit